MEITKEELYELIDCATRMRIVTEYLEKSAEKDSYISKEVLFAICGISRKKEGKGDSN